MWHLCRLGITASSVAVPQPFPPGHRAPQLGFVIDLGPVASTDKPIQKDRIVYRITDGPEGLEGSHESDSLLRKSFVPRGAERISSQTKAISGHSTLFFSFCRGKCVIE